MMSARPPQAAARSRHRIGVARPALALVLAAALAACAGPGDRHPAPVPEVRPGISVGYLDDAALPDSLTLVPAPPVAGSAALAQDHAVAAAALVLRGSPRWEQATRDADLVFPQAAGTFACALGVEIDDTHTPHLVRLLRRSLADAARSVRAAKHQYQRARPFTENGAPTCTPDSETGLRTNGSYPSGHTAIGWSWALLLAEAAPERADAVLLRGRQYGESRLVCNVHWQSDVLQGRFLGAATVARLHAEPAFAADMAAATDEIRRARAAGRTPTSRDCATEAAALARPVPGAL